MREMIIVGFTGTRKGMSENQKIELSQYLDRLRSFYDVVIFAHGACCGADVEADGIARNNGCEIHIYPSTNSATRIHCEEPGDVVHRAKPPLVRDHDIVDFVSLLLASPENEKKEEQRSGTWATVRYGRKILGKENVILLER